MLFKLIVRSLPIFFAMLALAPWGLRAQDTVGATPEPAVEKAQDAQVSQEANSEKTSDSSQVPSKPDTNKAQNTTQAPSNSSVDNTLDATEGDADIDRHTVVPWNEYRGRNFTIRFGAGFLYEVAAYSQDTQSKEQFALSPDGKLRDFRFILGGSFPKLKRLTWSAGIMYDAPTNSWLIRQTGVMIAIPEIWGHIFIGRGKEGFSLNKVMTGYDGWTMERFTMSDATIPILADGIKWLGYVPKLGLLWNVGYYNDFASKGQSFSTYSSEEVARVAWLPILSDERRTVLHLGVNLRYGVALNGQLRLKSRPEAFPAPYFVDTGTFPANSTTMAGYEVYYRTGPWMFGSEYWFTHVSSSSEGNPLFKGGDAVATYLLTGETRVYDTAGGFFREIVPARPVFKGGPGAWELLLRYSGIDLNSRSIQGGQFQRITPGLNWYLTDSVRLEFEYGYGHLDRFNLHGNTQFFQTRIQLQL
jgi:phosphate-selective porin OprO/OprP